MNADNSKKYNEDFKDALNIYENEYSHENLIYFLKSGSIAQKQAAALKLDSIDNDYDAEVIISNLTGCDGKIREAVSFRLAEFTKSNPKLFIKFVNIFLDAIIDINGNICRNTISAIKNLQNYPEFTEPFCNNLCQKAFELAQKAEKFDIQEGKYKINKEVFKLYWYLETINEFLEYINHDTLLNILSFAKNVHDYTIREKVAKIISNLKSDDTSLLKEEMRQDENYYVRRF